MAGSVFLITLFVNYLTMAPTVTLVDSGELIVAARGLGVAHPPGFPLYCALVHLATYLPLGNIAERVNFASAVFAACAAAAITLIVAEITLWARPSPGAVKLKGKLKRRQPSVEGVPAGGFAGRLCAAAPCVFAGLTIAFSRTLWGYATIAEVYTLNSMLIALIILLMLRWRRSATNADAGFGFRITGRSSEQPSRPQRQDGWLYAAALLFGIALGVHHVTVGLMLPGLAALVYGTEGFGFFKSRRLLFAALISTAGLIAVYAYLPIAAARGPVLNWGDPTTLGRIWLHISGWQYRVFLQFSAGRIGEMAWEFMRFYAREFGPPWFPLVTGLAAVGFFRLFGSRDRATSVFLGLIVAADLAYGLGYEIAEDKDAYYLPLLIAIAILAGAGAIPLLLFIRKKLPALNSFSLIGPLVVILLPSTTLAANLSFNNRSRYYVAHDYVDNILSTIQPGGTLLTLDWQVYSPLMYVREIERIRTDLVAIDINLLRRSWYYPYLEREYPDLVDHTRDSVQAFLEDLRHWEADPDAFQNDAALNRRITDRFNRMIMSFIAYQARKADVYVTVDIAANMTGENPQLTKSIGEAYQLVPEGLVFRLAADQRFQDPVVAAMNTRGLFDGTLSFDADDVVRTKVIPVYLNMLVNRGRYLAAHGQYDRAREAYRQALELDPDFHFARQSLAETSTVMEKAPPTTPH
jgi:hypothetical protein